MRGRGREEWIHVLFTCSERTTVASLTFVSVIYGREGVLPIAAPRLTPVAVDHLLDLLPLRAGRPQVLSAHVATPQRTGQTCCRQSPLTCLDLSACGNFHTYNTLAKAIIERLYLWTNTIGSQDPMQCIPLSWPFRTI